MLCGVGNEFCGFIDKNLINLQTINLRIQPFNGRMTSENCLEGVPEPGWYHDIIFKLFQPSFKLIDLIPD